MMKHEQQTSRPEKSSIFFWGNNFLKLNLYEYFMTIPIWLNRYQLMKRSWM